jgi:3-oxoacyl-[acyl-carrier-protein] synthase-3
MENKTAAITGVGAWLPENKLTNADLEQMVETNDEWIQTRTGVQERRILKEKELGTSYMAEKAVKDLLRKTNTDPEEVDCLICSTVTPDMLFPATANIITDKTGLVNAFGFDVEAACSGLLYTLSIGAKYIESGFSKKTIIVGADKMSSIVDYEDRATCILFGDAGTAMLLEPSEEGYGFKDAVYRSDGSGRKHLHMKAGGSIKPPSCESVRNREHYVYQEGKQVFKEAVPKMAEVSTQVMERNGLTASNIQYFVPHQANKRIIDAAGQQIGLSEDKVMMNIQRYGNTTSATIPLCLWEWENELKAGDNLILSAFGGGFTWGAVYLQWAYG